MSKRVRTNKGRRCSLGITMRTGDSIFLEAPDGSGYAEIYFKAIRGSGRAACVVVAPRTWPIRRKAEHLPGVEAGEYDVSTQNR